MNNKNHRVVIVEIENEKIKYSREYQWTGDFDYKEFLGIDGKEFEYSLT